MPFTLLLDVETCEIEILARQPRLLLRIDSRIYAVDPATSGTSGLGNLNIDGAPVAFARAFTGERQSVRLDGRSFEAVLAGSSGEGAGAGGGADIIKAPMPGVVVRVHKEAGETVSRGDTVLTIESMKLQMALVAARDGVIGEILIAEGGSFDKDAVLVRLASAGEE